jgi:Four helix bundle sensory module for signal transduction
MTTKPGSLQLNWLLGGVVFLALLMVVVVLFRRDTTPAQRLSDKAGRVDVVARMQLGLASASEAEKSAVLAVSDKDSEMFADQARVATAAVEQDRQDIGALLAATGTERERDLLAQFSKAFADLQRIDKEVLDLAVKNTNLKAYSLLFGAAASTLAEMDAALARVIARHADSTDAKRAMMLAFGARLGVLRMQTLLAPHIAEESDQKMDQMEATMSKEEVEIRKDLDGLVALAKSDADLAIATAQFARYEELKGRILALSRENTNVRSLALSLNQKRRAMVLCLESLSALKATILEEPITGVSYGRVPKPR